MLNWTDKTFNEVMEELTPETTEDRGNMDDVRKMYEFAQNGNFNSSKTDIAGAMMVAAVALTAEAAKEGGVATPFSTVDYFSTVVGNWFTTYGGE